MRTLKDIFREYISWSMEFIEEDEDWDTDDLIELGVIINKILRERSDG